MSRRFPATKYAHEVEKGALDDIGYHEMKCLLGEPAIEEVYHVTGEPGPHAPELVYSAIEWEKFRDLVSDDEIVIVDVGKSYSVSDPRLVTGNPGKFTAPEVLFRIGHPLGLAADLWSLACTLLELTVSCWFDNEIKSLVRRMERFIGPMPPHYRERAMKLLHREEVARWKRRRDDRPKPESLSLQNDDDPLSGSLTEPTGAEKAAAEESRGQDNLIDITLGSGFCFPHLLQAADGSCLRSARGYFQMQEYKYRLSHDDIPIFGDLLRKMFRYGPEERLRTSEVLQNEWFKREPRYIRVVEKQFPKIDKTPSIDEAGRPRDEKTLTAVMEPLSLS